MPNRAFIRFPNITVPHDSQILQAFVRFTAYSSRSGGTMVLRCGFVEEDDPIAPSSYADLLARSVVNWVSWTITGNWVDGSVYDTPDLTEEFQAIVDRGGWADGQAMLFIVEVVSADDYREWSAFEYNNVVESAKLCVRYLGREPNPQEFGDLGWHTHILTDVQLGGSYDPIDSFGIDLQSDSVEWSSDAVADPSPANLLGIGLLRSRYVLQAPLDVQVDYDFSQWQLEGPGCYGGISFQLVFFSSMPSYLDLVNIGGGYVNNVYFYIWLSATNVINLSSMLMGDADEHNVSPFPGLSTGTFRIIVNDANEVHFFLNGVLFHTHRWEDGGPFVSLPINLNYIQIRFMGRWNINDGTSAQSVLFRNLKINKGTVSGWIPRVPD